MPRTSRTKNLKIKFCRAAKGRITSLAGCGTQSAPWQCCEPDLSTGDRPTPPFADCASGHSLERADNGMAAQDDQIVIARLPTGAGILVGCAGVTASH